MSSSVGVLWNHKGWTRFVGVNDAILVSLVVFTFFVCVGGDDEPMMRDS